MQNVSVRRRIYLGGGILAFCLALAVQALPAQDSQASGKAGSEATASSEPKAAAADQGSELAQLKQQLAAQQQEIEKLEGALKQQQQLVDRVLQSQGIGGATDRSTDLASTVPLVPRATNGARPVEAPAAGKAAGMGKSVAQAENNEPKKPLSFTIGDAEFTPGGFLDFTTVFRSTNLGSGIGTSFGSIPFSGTPAGSLTETRLSMQNSRLSLMVTSNVKSFNVKGYIESDYLGNAAPNVFVTSNSNTFRSRLYWVQLRKAKFEFLAGQSWTMLTPNRNGISPVPSDLFYSQDMDTNYQVGLTWARQAGVRFIYHASDAVTAGVAIENPQQFVGAATLPSKFPATEVETGAGNTATPNLHPDVIGKVAFDPKVGNLHQHIEIAGLLTSAKVFDPTTNTTGSTTGGGGSVNFNFEVVKNLHAIVDTFYSDGGGRYIFALGPQFVVRPDASGNLGPAMVHSGSGIAGFEYQVTQPTMLYGYYGGAYFGRYTAFDPATGKLIGFGYSGSSASQNRAVQEGTFGIIQTFWKNPHYGALQLITQYSYLTRAPWFVAPATPKDAHLSMGYLDVRYVLP